MENLTFQASLECDRCHGKGFLPEEGGRRACGKCLGLGKITTSISLEDLAERVMKAIKDRKD